VLTRVRQHAGGPGSGRGAVSRGGRGSPATESPRGPAWSDASFDTPSGSSAPSAAPSGSSALSPQEAPAAPAARPYDRSDPIVRVEREALKLAIQSPVLCGPEFDALGAPAFTIPVHASVFNLIGRCGGVVAAGRAREWVAALLDAAPNDTARAFVTEMAVEPLQIPGDPDARYAEVVLASVGALAVGREIIAVKARLQRMNPLEEEGYNRMFGDLVALERRRKTLLDRATGS
jgi:DNA primase